MMDWLTDKRFLVGAAVGFFLLPRLAKTVQGLMSRSAPVAMSGS